MYSINYHPIGRYLETVFLNDETQEKLQILPEFGGMINGLVLSNGIQLVELIVGSKNVDELFESGLVKFEGSKLFPFPNRIEKGTYKFSNKSYQLPINELSGGNALHGLVWNVPFRWVKQEIQSQFASVELEYENDGDLHYFPFKYKLQIHYELHATNGCTITTKITNLGPTEMPLGDGWHPYFTLESAINNLELEIPHENILELDEKMIPTGVLLNKNKYTDLNPIFETHFDTGFVLNEKNQKHITKLINRKSRLELNIWQETGKNKYNFIQLYTPKDRKSIAIEPMTCAPNAFNNHLGIIKLEPKETLKLSFGVGLKIF